MKNKIALLSFALFAGFISQPALADIKIRAGVAKASYSVSFDQNAFSQYRNRTAKADYISTNLGVSFVAENGFYVDLAASGGSGTHDLWNYLGTAPKSFERKDIALIFGKSNVRENGFATAFYGGIKTGETVLGSPASNGWTEDRFTASGIVGGYGVSIPLGGAGILGVNAGLGLMSATWKDNQSPTSFSAKSDSAAGVSLALAYTYPISDAMGVTLDYKFNSYSYSFSSSSGNTYTVSEVTGALGANFYAKF